MERAEESTGSRSEAESESTELSDRTEVMYGTTNCCIRDGRFEKSQLEARLMLLYNKLGGIHRQ